MQNKNNTNDTQVNNSMLKQQTGKHGRVKKNKRTKRKLIKHMDQYKRRSGKQNKHLSKQ